MTIRQMTINDVSKLKLEEPWMCERFTNAIENELGPAFIVEEGGRAICAFGGLFEWGNKGACEVWFNLIEKRHILNVARIFKRLIVKLAEKYEVTRMQAIVRCDSAVNNRFMEFMGFINETPFGMKNKLYNGRDAFMYARYF